MSERDSELERRLDDLGKSHVGDHVTNVVKATLSGVPIVGSPFASLIDDYIPKRREQVLIEFTKDLARDLEAVKDSIDQELIHKDDFAYMFVRVYQDVSREHKQEKLDAYRKILVGSLIVNDVDQEMKEWYLSLVEQMTLADICLIAVMSQACKEPRYNSNNGRYASVDAVFSEKCPNLKPDLIRLAMSHLELLGITFGLNQPRGISSGFSFGHMRNYLSALGKGLVEFLDKVHTE